MHKSIFLAMLTGALVAPRAARADAPPTTDAVKKALPTWTTAIAVPFTYQGLEFESDKPDQVEACQRDFKSHGVVKNAAKLPAFLDCLKISNAGFALLGKPEYAAFDPKKPSPAMSGTIAAANDMGVGWYDKGYPAKLAKLGKDKALIVAHTENPNPGADPWDEAWSIWAAHADGGVVKFDALMVVESIPSPD